MAHASQTRELKNSSYELFILLLSFLSLFNLLVVLTPSVDPVIKGVVSILDAFITVVFIIDFLYRLFTADSKSHYFVKGWGWADLLASLPFPQVKIFRIFRIIRVFRLLREFGLRNMLAEIRENRAGSALYLTIFLVIMVLEFGGTSIVYVEKASPDANIKSASDGVWWAFVTITTVGYGDRFPVTNTGRLVGMWVMTLGVGLFGVLTGFLANRFLAPSGDEAAADGDEAISQAEMAEFRRLLDRQERVNAALMAKLEQLERLLPGDSQPPPS